MVSVGAPRQGRVPRLFDHDGVTEPLVELGDRSVREILDLDLDAVGPGIDAELADPDASGLETQPRGLDLFEYGLELFPGVPDIEDLDRRARRSSLDFGQVRRCVAGKRNLDDSTGWLVDPRPGEGMLPLGVRPKAHHMILGNETLPQVGELDGRKRHTIVADVVGRHCHEGGDRSRVCVEAEVSPESQFIVKLPSGGVGFGGFPLTTLPFV
jgi:hypothetical protein